LAITQAAGFMAETGMPAREYLRLLETQAARLLDHGTPGTYPRSLAAATRLTAERLEADDPGTAELAGLCAFLGPEPIPESLFTANTSKLPGDLAAKAADPLAWRQSLGQLTRRSLARVDHRGLVMHRLTQAILRDRLTPARAAAARGHTEAILVASNPHDQRNPRVWPSWAQLIPHLLAADLAGTGNPGLRKMACNACGYLLNRGDAFAAHDLASELRRQWREQRGDDDEHAMSAASHLAWALYHRLPAPTWGSLQRRQLKERLGDRLEAAIIVHTGLHAEEISRDLAAAVRHDRRRGFDLRSRPPVGARVLRRGGASSTPGGVSRAQLLGGPYRVGVGSSRLRQRALDRPQLGSALAGVPAR
jgi:hypothetical protein